MNAIKFVYLLWDLEPLAPNRRCEILLGQCAEKILALQVAGLKMNIVDENSLLVPSPAPKIFGPKPFTAQINVWLTEEACVRSKEVITILAKGGFRVHAYEVDEWLYTEYGENQWEKPRYWPDGERSPGVLSLTIIERKSSVPQDEWMRRWFSWQSPMSEWLQPRSRYARNLISAAVNTEAPYYEGLVEEAWPSREHVVNKLKFFNARNRLELIRNSVVMLRSVNSILKLMQLTTVMASEYIIKTPEILPKSK